MNFLFVSIRFLFFTELLIRMIMDIVVVMKKRLKLVIEVVMVLMQVQVH